MKIDNIIKFLHKQNNNCTTIKELNIYKNCYNNDFITKDVIKFKNFDEIYMMKYNYKKNKKYYYIIIEKIENILTLDIIKEKIDKLYNLFIITKNNKNKYYQKFLRRIKYNILNNIYLFISCEKIEDDAINYINNFNNKKSDDYNEKKDFYDFINILI